MRPPGLFGPAAEQLGALPGLLLRPSERFVHLTGLVQRLAQGFLGEAEPLRLIAPGLRSSALRFGRSATLLAPASKRFRLLALCLGPSAGALRFPGSRRPAHQRARVVDWRTARGAAATPVPSGTVLSIAEELGGAGVPGRRQARPACRR